jgi:hypothetical protein
MSVFWLACLRRQGFEPETSAYLSMVFCLSYSTLNIEDFYSETSVKIYQTALSYNEGYITVPCHHIENLKSKKFESSSIYLKRG